MSEPRSWRGWTSAEQLRLDEMAKTQLDEWSRFVCAAALREIEERGRELERLKKLIDYLEQYGPKPLNERLERAEAEVERLQTSELAEREAKHRIEGERDSFRREVERLRADLTQAQAEANVRGDRVVEYRERWQKAKARLAKVVEKLEGKLDILKRGYCSPTFDREDVAIMLRDVLAAAQPEEERRG